MRIPRNLDSNQPKEQVDLLLAQLDRIEANLAVLIGQRVIPAYYTTKEAAQLLGLAEFTVRNYCRLGRIRGEKKGSGRGKYQSWVVSQAEVERVRRQGLLPLCRAATL
jgi:hypothetical protein